MMTASNSIEILLKEVCKAQTNKINKLLDGVGLHIGQAMMLSWLYEENGVSQANLAKKMVIGSATTSTMIKRLEKKGYIMKKRDSKDERISNVYLTDAGREISSQLEDFKGMMEKTVFNGFSENEKKNMRAYLERIMNNLAK